MQHKNVLIFMGGALTGGIVSWYYTKKKYEEISRSEIATMRELYRKKNEDLAIKARVKPDPEYLVNEIEKQADRIQYNKIVVDNSYVPSDDGDDDLEHSDETLTFIDSDEFLSMNGYDKVNLVLYRDEVLAREIDDEIVLSEDTIGQEAIDNLKEYKPEAVYVRNEETKTEYEVTRDDRTYGEVTGIYMKEYDDQ